MKHFIALLLALAIPTSAFGNFYDGNRLIQMLPEYEKDCANQPKTDYATASDFSGYITGVYDATQRNYTTPDGLTRGQICLIVAKYLKENPEKLHMPASEIIQAALLRAFPKS